MFVLGGVKVVVVVIFLDTLDSLSLCCEFESSNTLMSNAASA